MGQPGMRITVNAAMRARDVSRPWPDGGAPAAGAEPGERGDAPRAEPAKRSRAAKNERRRLGKRGGARKAPENEL
ncbi:hypothetical protein [Actinomadura verrucosospora]|uniref:Uncharacterized protein n=1 Tax=Actinomadura verrucosospora TaxID=46165 RepID=A0A7D4A5M9_ACTVE|nr:hypothetical protein [Actinomadura verrucosospora]QKG21467.1 hypothetical protein ACTIVE_3105 [Actinomadura verrucosospora]